MSIKKDKGSNKNHIDNIEIWEDIVNLRDLIMVLIICLSTTFICYFLSPNKAPWPLFLGLIGAISGFILSSILIKPKRDLIQESGDE